MRFIPLTTLLLLASCGGDKSGDADAASLPADSAATTPVPAATAERSTAGASSAPESGQGVQFDPAALSKGAKVGTVTADMLTLSRASDSVTWVGSARFVGELTLSGRAVPHVDANVREVCFEPDAASAALLPHWSGDTRRTWFCFSNQPEAQQSLAALREKRLATVVIDRYTINKGQSDQENSAELVRVVSRGEPIP